MAATVHFPLNTYFEGLLNLIRNQLLFEPLVGPSAAVTIAKMSFQVRIILSIIVGFIFLAGLFRRFYHDSSAGKVHLLALMGYLFCPS